MTTGALRAFACLEGNEERILEELRALAPRAAAASVGPGLVLARDAAVDERLAIARPLHPVFARAEFTAWGEAAAGPAAVRRAAASIAAGLDDPESPPALHVFAQGDREREARAAEARRLERRLRRALGGRVRSKIAAEVGDEVIDVVQAGDRIVWGAHRRTPLMSAFPGGQRRLAARPEAPSRAHLKLEEGLEWAALEPRPGDVAIDAGCSPGGWSWVLLERGLAVHGVDPTPVAPALRGRAGFTHHPVPVSRFDPSRVGRVRFLFCDMNGPPRDALGQLVPLAARCRGLETIFYTVKLSDDPPLETMALVRARLAAAGFPAIRARHLYHNREELTVVAEPAKEGPGRGA
jgi:23S rRNA (cytidine2498-2'-O)-methyltransferase